MISFEKHKDKIRSDGFSVIAGVFNLSEVESMISVINQSKQSSLNFRKNKDLFAIRNLLAKVPALAPHLWTNKFNAVIDSLLGESYHSTKAIYFDKPASSNWLVPRHQDTTISVDRKENITGFGPWTIKEGLVSVQPSEDILNDMFAIRIHLDDCDHTNGALKVVPGTHQAGVVRNNLFQSKVEEAVCPVPRGGIMIMRPLLWHSSGKSTSEQHRRVIHLEFSSKILPAGLRWGEYSDRKLK